MKFNDDRTVLIVSGFSANICEYEIINENTIGLSEMNYYRLWQFDIDGDRMTLTRDFRTDCSDVEGEVSGSLLIRHFYKD